MRNYGVSAGVLLALLLHITGCTLNPALQTERDSKPSELRKIEGISYGLIKRELITGVSTQADVIEKFGSPNNMIYQSGGRGELWIYDKIHTESITQTQSAVSGGFLGGGGGGVGAVVGSSNSQGSTKTNSTVKMLTVILEFDGSGILVNVIARQGGY